jgi:diguanylate cyclase (GGDEF)-like protein
MKTSPEGPDWDLVKAGLARDVAAVELALASAGSVFERVDLLLALAGKLYYTHIDRSAALLGQARDLARDNGYPVAQARSLTELARHALGVSNLDEVARLCFEALELLKGSPPADLLATIYLALGWMCDYLGDYSAAMDWGHKGLDLAGIHSFASIHARLLDLVACIHSQMDDHNSAIQIHADAIAVTDAGDDLFTRASVLNNQAMTLVYAGDFESALKAGVQCLEIGQVLGMRRQVYNYADTVGEILLEMGRLEQAEEVLNEALEMTQSLPADISHCYILKNLGRVSMARGKLDAAEAYLQQATRIFEQLNVRGELALCHQLMSTARERQGDFAGALDHFRTFYALREATAGKESARRLAVLKTSYDIQLAQRDAEIERLRNVELQAEIEERKRIQIVLEKLATTDMLTNLASRHHFFALAEREVERSLRYKHPLSMLMMDIDYFKRVNDTLGHIAGDQVLIAIGEVIRSSLREVDIAGRYGGEEFSILLPDTPVEIAVNVGERVRTSLANLAVETDAGRVNVTASIGVAGLRVEGNNSARELATMLDRADRALYAAKNSGRNATRAYE